MTISFASLVFFKSLIPFFAVLVISSIGTGLALPCINSFITGSVSTDKRGFVTSLYGSVRFLGVAIGPPVYSTLMDWSTNRNVFNNCRTNLVSKPIMYDFNSCRQKRAF